MKGTRKQKDQFEVIISGEGINLTRTIDAEKLAILLPIVLGSTAKTVPSEFAAVGSVTSPQTKELEETLREYLDKVGAITNVELIVAIAHYIWERRDEREFSMGDIRSQFLSAQEKLPSNLPRDFRVALNKGMIAQVPGKADYYYITKTGIRAVEDRKTFNMNRNNRGEKWY